MNTTWHGDWGSRIKARIADLGFPSARSFADAHISLSYIDLAIILGDDVAAVQVESVLHDEAIDQSELTYFSRSSLVRRLNQALPKGWGLGARADFKAASAFANWTASLPDAHQERCRRIFKRIQDEASKGWRPGSPSDPIISSAFQGESFDSVQ